MNKVIKDGKVAVLYSPNFGAGWSTWNNHKPYGKECLFCPEIVAIVEREDFPSEKLIEKAQDIAMSKWGSKFCTLGIQDGMKVMWIPEGTLFQVYEGARGNEYIELCDEVNWIVA